MPREKIYFNMYARKTKKDYINFTNEVKNLLKCYLKLT